MKAGLLSAWVTAVAIITYRTVKNGNVAQGANDTWLPAPVNHLPMPANYASSILVYGALGLLPASANALATTMGWGFVVAMLLNLWGVNPKGATLVAAPPAQNLTGAGTGAGVIAA